MYNKITLPLMFYR